MESQLRTYPADDYHPHYPDRTRDYFARLLANAERMGDRHRLAFYDPAKDDRGHPVATPFDN